MCAEYEYEPKSIFGTGQASPLQHVKVRTQRPLGFLAAKERAMPLKKASSKKVVSQNIASPKKAGKSRK